MHYRADHRFVLLYGLAQLLEELAKVAAAEWRRRNRPPPRPRGATLRPGPDTPLWNSLVDLVSPRVRPRGAKATLARELLLDRSRMTQFFVRRTAMPDAERALELLVWLARSQRSLNRRMLRIKREMELGRRRRTGHVDGLPKGGEGATVAG